MIPAGLKSKFALTASTNSASVTLPVPKVSIAIDTFGTGKVSESELVEAVRANFDLRPAGIIKMLDLKQPIYKQTAAYGHFGRTDVLLPWEKLDKVNVLKDTINKV